jgi:hypothetical protein
MTPLCTSEYIANKHCRRLAFTLYKLDLISEQTGYYNFYRELFDYYAERMRTVK